MGNSSKNNVKGGKPRYKRTTPILRNKKKLSFSGAVLDRKEGKKCTTEKCKNFVSKRAPNAVVCRSCYFAYLHKAAVLPA